MTGKRHEPKTFRARFRPSGEELREIARKGAELMLTMTQEEMGQYTLHSEPDSEPYEYEWLSTYILVVDQETEYHAKLRQLLASAADKIGGFCKFGTIEEPDTPPPRRTPKFYVTPGTDLDQIKIDDVHFESFDDKLYGDKVPGDPEEILDQQATQLIFSRFDLMVSEKHPVWLSLFCACVRSGIIGMFVVESDDSLESIYSTVHQTAIIDQGFGPDPESLHILDLRESVENPRRA